MFCKQSCVNKLGCACTGTGLTNPFETLCFKQEGFKIKDLWCPFVFPQGPGVQVWAHRGSVAVNPPRGPWALPAPQSFVKPFCKPSIVAEEKSRRAESTKSSSILVIFFTLVRPLQCCGVFEKRKIPTNSSGVTFLK